MNLESLRVFSSFIPIKLRMLLAVLISILLPTINRTELAVRAVESVYAQTYQDFEVLVLDQSEEATDAFNKFDERLRYFHLDKAGLTYARNVGISLAKGTIIGILDDDAKYHKTCLDIVSRNFNEQVFLLTGIVKDPKTGETLLRGMIDEPVEIGYGNALKCCISTAMFFSSTYLKGHPFDQRFGVGMHWGSGEETDLVLSIVDDGMKVLYLPEIKVYHQAASKDDIKPTKVRAYALGFGAVMAKHTIEARKTKAVLLFIHILIRQVGGMILYFLRGNVTRTRYYLTSFKYQLCGFFEFTALRIHSGEATHGKK